MQIRVILSQQAKNLGCREPPRWWAEILQFVPQDDTTIERRSGEEKG